MEHFDLDHRAFAFPHSDADVRAEFFKEMRDTWQLQVSFRQLKSLDESSARSALKNVGVKLIMEHLRDVARSGEHHCSGRRIINTGTGSVRRIHGVPAYGSEAWLEDRFRAVADDPWGHSWKAYESKRYTFVLEAIRKRLQGESLELLADSCLDIGCSTGHFSNKLSDLFQRVVAVDVSHTAVERAKLNYPEIDFHCRTLPHLGFGSGTFKLVTCLEVLYYLDRDVLDSALEEISRVLSSDGLVVFSAVSDKSPYFTTQELLARISKVFDVDSCQVSGSQLY